MKKTISTMLIGIIFLIGLAVLLYPSVSNYVNERNATRAIASYDDAVSAAKAADDAGYLETAREYNAYLTEFQSLNDAAVTEIDRGEDGPYNSLLDINGTGIMGVIRIPAIQVNLPIYHGTEETVLQIGAGHYLGSSLPVGGESTHAVLTGHRGLPSAELFTDLDRLAEGDVFYIQMLNEVLEYEIDQIQVVLPEEVDTLSIEAGKDYVTLVTCTPYGVNSHRLLLRGTRIPYDGMDQEKTQTIASRAVREEEGRTLQPKHWLLIGGAAVAAAMGAALLIPSGKKSDDKTPHDDTHAEKGDRNEKQ